MFVKWLKSPGAHMLLILPAQAGRGNKAKTVLSRTWPLYFPGTTRQLDEGRTNLRHPGWAG